MATIRWILISLTVNLLAPSFLFLMSPKKNSNQNNLCLCAVGRFAFYDLIWSNDVTLNYANYKEELGSAIDSKPVTYPQFSLYTSKVFQMFQSPKPNGVGPVFVWYWLNTSIIQEVMP